MSNLPGSIINSIKLTQCGWDKKILGQSTMTQKGHSRKELMRCLYKSNLEIRKYILKERELNDKIKGLEGELGQYVVKEEMAKTNKGTGLLSNPDTGIDPFNQPLEKDIDAETLLKAEKELGNNIK